MDHLFALAVLLGTGTGDSPIDARTWQDYNHLRMPAHGTVYKGMLYGFLDDKWTDKKKGGGPPYLNAIPLARTAKMNWKEYPFLSSGYNLRHHVGNDALWFSNSTGFLNKWDFERIQEIADSILEPTDALGRNIIISGISLVKLMEIITKIEQAAIDAKEFLPPDGEATRFVAFDSVPISNDSCTTFLLMKKEKKFESWRSKGAVFYKLGQRKPLLPVLTNFDSFDSAFTEHFYAFVRKDHYYFVTESGKLHHAPPLKEGETSRTMKALWDDAKRPIVAVIEDADRDKVWLFAKDKNAGAKLDLFFEMKEKIEPQTFDPAKLRPVNVEGRAKALLEYLPLISRDEKK